jgi:hypothetical protein
MDVNGRINITPTRLPTTPIRGESPAHGHAPTSHTPTSHTPTRSQTSTPRAQTPTATKDSIMSAFELPKAKVTPQPQIRSQTQPQPQPQPQPVWQQSPQIYSEPLHVKPASSPVKPASSPVKPQASPVKPPLEIPPVQQRAIATQSPQQPDNGFEAFSKRPDNGFEAFSKRPATRVYTNDEIAHILVNGYIKITPELWEYLPEGSQVCFFKQGADARNLRFRPGGFIKRHYISQEGKKVFYMETSLSKTSDGYLTYPMAYDDVAELYKRYSRECFVEMHLMSMSLAQKSKQIADLLSRVEKLEGRK